MAEAERAYQRLEAQKSDLFAAPGQIEFPGIQEHLDNQTRAKNRDAVITKLPEIIHSRGWRETSVEAREVFAAIVDAFQWSVLQKEYLEALREFKTAGCADFAELKDKSTIHFPQ